MSQSEKAPIDIGAEVAKGMYSDVTFERHEVQPIYVLHRDTIRTFLHEKLSLFEQKGKLLGLLGIEVSLVAAQVTATFNDWLGIKGTFIASTFFVLTLVCGFFTLKEAAAWWNQRGSLGVDQLSDELGNRGSVIRPNAHSEGS